MIKKIQEKLEKCTKLNPGKCEENVKTLAALLQRLRSARKEDDISPLKQAVENTEYSMAKQRLAAGQTESVEE